MQLLPTPHSATNFRVEKFEIMNLRHKHRSKASSCISLTSDKSKYSIFSQPLNASQPITATLLGIWTCFILLQLKRALLLIIGSLAYLVQVIQISIPLP